MNKFIRPKQITSEEVTFYKEQKVCLVCKGKALGFNIFVCSHCDALYCKNCASQLTDLENVCWACNRPIDKSKPSTPFKEEEKDESIPITKENKGMKS